jgi:hypothetical protein
MPAVASNLPRLATETRHEVVGKTLRDPQEPVLSGRFEVDHRCFDQVPGNFLFSRSCHINKSSNTDLFHERSRNVDCTLHIL